MTKAEEAPSGLAWLVRIRHGVRTKRWLVPVACALIGFIVPTLIAPVSGESNRLDKMTSAFGILLGVGSAFVVALFAFRRSGLRRLNPPLVYLYAICAVVGPLLGILPGMPNTFYAHRWGSGLDLGVAVAGTLGVFTTLLVAW